jgi:hypothetical protein
VNSIEDAARRLRQTGYQAESPVFEDLLQGIRGLFLKVPSLGDASRLELLENLPGSKVLSSFLRNEWSLTAYHVGFMWERGVVEKIESNSRSNWNPWLCGAILDESKRHDLRSDYTM